MRTGNPPDELEVLVIFRVLRAGYRVVLLRLVLAYLMSWSYLAWVPIQNQIIVSSSKTPSAL